MEQNKIPSLTGLRFFAALSVALAHFTGWFDLFDPAKATSIAERAYFKIVWDSGADAVSLFYVLSGFIMVYAYSDPDGRIIGSLRSFFAARFARIYPAYLVGFALGAVPYFLWQAGPFLGNIRMAALTLTFLQTWTGVEFTQWNPPGWSVSVEAFFYAIFPFLLVLMARLKTKTVLILFVGLYGATFSGAITYLNNHNFGGYAAVTPIFRLPEFMIGMCCGLLFSRDAVRLFASRVPTSAVLLLLASAMTATATVSYTWRHNGLLAPFLAAAIFWIALDRGMVARILSLPIFVLLGEASYSLYITHWPIEQMLKRIVVTDSCVLALAIYLTTVIAFSIACYLLVERPSRVALRNWLSRPKSSTEIRAVQLSARA